MRTYARKRPEYKIIEGVHDMCRLCLSKCEESVPIFTEEKENVCATLALRIMICVGLEISREDRLPNMICVDCLTELNRYYAFRKKCEMTYQKLKSHVLAKKEQEYKATQKNQSNMAIMLDKNMLPVKQDEDNNYIVEFDKDQLVDIMNVNGVDIANVNGIDIVNINSLDIANINGINITNVNGINIANINGINIANVNGVNIASVNGVPVANIDPVDIRNQNGLTQLVNDENVSPEIPSTSNHEVKDTPASGPDISTFLTAMLIEMGIIAQQDDSLAVLDDSIRSLDLEAGDGRQVTFELVEEDCESFDAAADPLNVDVNNYTEPNPIEKKDITIQYVMSNYADKKSTNNKQSKPCCDVCGKRFASRSAVARHLRTHTGERPFKCRDCGAAFSQAEVLARHRLVHAEVRPHRCGQCGAGFTQRGALAAHARAHAPPNKRALHLHRCTRCPKVFLYKSGLSRHMMAHAGRVYVCGACDKSFRDKSSLRRHLRNASHAPRPIAQS